MLNLYYCRIMNAEYIKHIEKTENSITKKDVSKQKKGSRFIPLSGKNVK